MKRNLQTQVKDLLYKQEGYISLHLTTTEIHSHTLTPSPKLMDEKGRLVWDAETKKKSAISV